VGACAGFLILRVRLEANYHVYAECFIGIQSGPVGRLVAAEVGLYLSTGSIIAKSTLCVALTVLLVEDFQVTSKIEIARFHN
jgi:hypothetical protein